ncbi:glycerophosphodiester phosphodiesterase family protein [Alkaliphilus crotonatoxidans]
MKKKVLVLLVVMLVALPQMVFSQESNTYQAPLVPEPQPLVAHAGGAIYGFRYTNSLEALDTAYKNGFRLIELDFNWTRDGQPVLIHDWGQMVSRIFPGARGVLSLEEFKTMPTLFGLTPMSLADLSAWLERHPDAFIITDVKEDNARTLAWIKHYYPEMAKQVIPQIYSFDEYSRVKNFGYENIILTLYRMNTTEEEVISFAVNNPLFALTIPLERDLSTLPQALNELGIPTYVHTVNDLWAYESLRDLGVYGIYTDYFQPKYWIAQ